MLSSTMVAQETSGSQSNTVSPSQNKIPSVTSLQSVVEEGHVPKIRKPYTITKQRERWTDEEHKKFLEALKLYRREWRKIEEYVGTKTTVQIRSHAQKFFSKVVRETKDSDACSTEPIEIPPPRPKRKPSHPYPRKLLLPLKKESPIKQHARSTSPNSSLSEQENQSSTSVLSAVVSDTLVSANSTTHNGSPSPISSANVNQTAILACDCEDNAPQYDVHASKSVPDDPVSVKLELLPSTDALDNIESTSTKVLKLFGKDVVVSSKPYVSSTCASKSSSLDMAEGLLQASSMNLNSIDKPVGIVENSWNRPTFYYMNGSTNKVEKPIPLPWWVFYRSISVPPSELQEKEIQREGSSADSNSDSMNGVENADMVWDVETQSRQCDPHCHKESKYLEDPRRSKKAALVEKTSIKKGIKGFVPYKRCYSDRDMQSSTISSGKKENQRIRLCL